MVVGGGGGGGGSCRAGRTAEAEIVETTPRRAMTMETSIFGAVTVKIQSEVLLV